MLSEPSSEPTVSTASKLFDLSGKVVVLTGASSGLGNRFASVLIAAGATVVAAARRRERLIALQAEVAPLRPNVEPAELLWPVACDITADGEPEHLVAEAIDRFGRVDIVVNNAGISRVLAAVDDSIDGFRQELAINLVAPYELARHAAKVMIDQGDGGAIINVGSVLGGGGGGRLKVPGYAASKGGLHNLTRELASQWARKGIRVNAIAPGWFGSEMTETMFSSDSGMNYITSNTPMGRPGSEDELDGALLFFASGASSFVTGHVLYVDGGWSAI